MSLKGWQPAYNLSRVWGVGCGVYEKSQHFNGSFAIIRNLNPLVSARFFANGPQFFPTPSPLHPSPNLNLAVLVILRGNVALTQRLPKA